MCPTFIAAGGVAATLQAFSAGCATSSVVGGSAVVGGSTFGIRNWYQNWRSTPSTEELEEEVDEPEEEKKETLGDCHTAIKKVEDISGEENEKSDSETETERFSGEKPGVRTHFTQAPYIKYIKSHL